MKKQSMRSKTLCQQRTKQIQRLPPAAETLRENLFQRELRCGKPNCHCADGIGHRVFYLSVTLSSGKTEQISLPKALGFVKK